MSPDGRAEDAGEPCGCFCALWSSVPSTLAGVPLPLFSTLQTTHSFRPCPN